MQLKLEDGHPTSANQCRNRLWLSTYIQSRIRAFGCSVAAVRIFNVNFTLIFSCFFRRVFLSQLWPIFLLFSLPRQLFDVHFRSRSPISMFQLYSFGRSCVALFKFIIMCCVLYTACCVLRAAWHLSNSFLRTFFTVSLSHVVGFFSNCLKRGMIKSYWFLL